MHRATGVRHAAPDDAKRQPAACILDRQPMTATDAIPLRRTPTDVPALLRGTVETLREQAAALDVSLSIEAPADLPRANVDAEKIAWAVATLVGNALRYVRRGTRLRPGGAIQVRIAKEPDAVAISVQDDGPGIPQDKVERLFVRGRGVTHGTGLGLMLIEDIVAAHGGTVRVQSQQDGRDSGTVVTMHLPVEGGP